MYKVVRCHISLTIVHFRAYNTNDVIAYSSFSLGGGKNHPLICKLWYKTHFGKGMEKQWEKVF